MKNITLIIVFLLSVITCGAQINRNFWGCELGMNSSTDVRRAIINESYTITEQTDARISVNKNDVEYGGLKWSYVDIKFENGLLYGVSFMNQIESYDDALAVYERISTALRRRYGQYVSDRKSKANDNIRQCQYFDGKTLVWLSLTHYAVSSGYYVYLGYSNAGGNN